MSGKTPKLPKIAESERTPLVTQLIEIVQHQGEIIQVLRDEIAVLKGNKPKPKIKPSGMETGDESDEEDKKSPKKRPRNTTQRSKTAKLEIHETKVIAAEHVPAGSTRKGYRYFTVQGLVIESHNIEYKLERWLTPDGDYVEAVLPADVFCHFSARTISFILYQYHQCHVTQPLLLEQLHEYGLDISAGQLNRLLVEGHESFDEEKAELLSTGLEVSPYIQADDTGARHQGKTGICTHIGNPWFAWFESTESKSRINFLQLLQAGQHDYILNEEAFDYMEVHKLAQEPLAKLRSGPCVFDDKGQWEGHLKQLGIERAQHIRIATEGALIGSLVEHGLNPDLVIISDDAGQFNILLHGLCWVHAERTIHKLIPCSDAQRDILAQCRSQIWDFYAELKTYRESPGEKKKIELNHRFDEIFTQESDYITLNLALRRLYKNKRELLLVLDRPEIPLHNNLSESDIREYAKRRKVSGSTRSDTGRKRRDTFISLKKTCRKLGVSFWQYLHDRVAKINAIPRLSKLIRQQVAEAT
mgnify:CR=1 FL=1